MSLEPSPLSSARTDDHRLALSGPADAIETLLALMRALRDPDHGCPWDVEQDFASIAPYTVEEAYEVVDAIARGDRDDLCDELGDLLLQVVFHARMAEEEGSFAFGDVVRAVVTKMLRRHPHVFADVSRDDPKAVKVRWEAIKAAEKAERAARRGQANVATTASALDGVPVALPPLQRALKLQQKAAHVGFDWPDAAQILDKVREETAEIEAELAARPLRKEQLADEIGDLFFVAVNLARKTGIDPASALERTNAKFIKRFQAVETELSGTDTPVGSADLATMEAAWQRAKRSP